MNYLLFALLLSQLSFITSDNLKTRFQTWVEDFKMIFKNEDHYISTFSKWKSTDEYINEINYRNLSFKLGHNQFSGMDSDDFSRFIFNNNLRELRINNINSESTNLRGSLENNIESLPESVD